jgi:hypothetical protein
MELRATRWNGRQAVVADDHSLGGRRDGLHQAGDGLGRTGRRPA